MARPLTVGIDVLSENPHRPSGATGYYINLVRELLQVDADLRLVLFVGRAGAALFDDHPHLRKVVLPWSNEAQKLRILEQHTLLPLLALRHRLDVLNSGNVGPFWSPCPLVATVKTMHHYTNPDTLPSGTRRYRVLAGGHTAKHARLIISNSESNSRDIKHYLNVPSERLRLVYEALDHEVFRPDLPAEAQSALLGRLGVRRPFVLFVSSLWPYKNADGLARGFAAVADRLPEHQLVFAGFDRASETSEALRALLEELGIAQRTAFTGGLPQQEIALLYASAATLVYPSRYETFGLPLLEAMATGCPVIAAERSSLPEVASGAACLVDPDSPRDIGEAIVRVATDQAYADDLRARGFERARQFSWRQTAEQTLAVYREAAGR